MTTGEWVMTTRSVNNGTYVTEKEILRIKPDHTFDVTIDVSLQKGRHYIKDLQVKASGIWKRYITTLVIVVQRIDVPFAKEVSTTIDMRSLEALAGIYRRRFETDPIHIYTIEFLDEKNLKVRNEEEAVSTYTKAKEIIPKPITPPKPVFVDEALKRQRR